jgi:hypothetical protein
MKYVGSAALAIIGAIALSASASAAIVCNDDGDCWRSKETYKYPPDAKVRVHEDTYVIEKNYKMREPGEGRGYWRGPPPGAWVQF